jgi:hypothetical protein
MRGVDALFGRLSFRSSTVRSALVAIISRLMQGGITPNVIAPL